MKEKHLSPAPPADRRTLIRRATYDLTGLPPTPEEIDAFLKDDSPDAFAKVVDRLLASPRLRRALGPPLARRGPLRRHRRRQLRLPRPADVPATATGSSTPSTATCPTTSSSASRSPATCCPRSDEADRERKLIATGYLAIARRFGSYEDARYPWHLTIEDTIDNLGRTFLGLTIDCARCHDHKFDPITQEDYYALYGFFSEHALSRGRGSNSTRCSATSCRSLRRTKVATAENERKMKLRSWTPR